MAYRSYGKKRGRKTSFKGKKFKSYSRGRKTKSLNSYSANRGGIRL